MLVVRGFELNLDLDIEIYRASNEKSSKALESNRPRCRPSPLHAVLAPICTEPAKPIFPARPTPGLGTQSSAPFDTGKRDGWQEERFGRGPSRSVGRDNGGRKG